MSRILIAACLVGVLVMANFNRRAGAARQLRAGDRLPELKGQTLTGRTAVLPQSSGKVTLVAMGLTYKSRFPVEAWAEWYRETIGSRTDVTFINRGMRNGTPTIRSSRSMAARATNELKALLAALADRRPAVADPDSSDRRIEP
jgi:hypothetical protein